MLALKVIEGGKNSHETLFSGPEWEEVKKELREIEVEIRNYPEDREAEKEKETPLHLGEKKRENLFDLLSYDPWLSCTAVPLRVTHIVVAVRQTPDETRTQELLNLVVDAVVLCKPGQRGAVLNEPQHGLSLLTGIRLAHALLRHHLVHVKPNLVNLVIWENVSKYQVPKSLPERLLLFGQHVSPLIASTQGIVTIIGSSIWSISGFVTRLWHFTSA